ncbi:hypothetical protein MSAN_01119600 [Mycena sanguinolenta]|uniref:Uncharacterized protein n=1 Tax=Mycena sanguinolenta TaxID=230812 RepID=A0A8H6YKW8_9AGAR|nr:hypothetical protein MSAN_01119600 [Mycena sanguinolenta]
MAGGEGGVGRRGCGVKTVGGEDDGGGDGDAFFMTSHTGKWWWNIQKVLEKLKAGAIIPPLIISTDKMQMTMF